MKHVDWRDTAVDQYRPSWHLVTAYQIIEPENAERGVPFNLTTESIYYDVPLKQLVKHTFHNGLRTQQVADLPKAINV